MKAFISIAAMAVLVVACASGPASDTTGADAGTPAGEWQLVGGAPMVGGFPITMTIEAGSVSGRAACNSYFGTVAGGDGSIRFDDLGQTEMACEPAVMESESVFLGALGSVRTYQVTGDRLSLSGPGVELIFEPVLPVPTADLVDTTWMLESLVQDDAVSSVSGDPATLILASDGTFVASTGCRTLSGRWIEGDGVIVVPEMAADGDCRADLAAQDSQVVSVVGDEFRFAVDGDTLTLTSMGGEGLIYRVDASMEDAGSPVGRWQLVEGVDIVDGFPIGLVVDSEQLSGRSGCNSYSAPVSLGEGSISPGEFTSTMMACGSPVDEVEISYQTSLMVVTRYRVAGGRLTLTGPDVELVFEPATPSATADVVDRFWVLESLGGGDVASGDSATLTLDSDGTLSGGIGCRTFTGRWAEQDGMVVVADFETEGECRGELVDQDAYVVSVLDGTVYTDVDGYTLTVTSAGGEVLVYGS